jgi:dTDP-4-amino-4,6-dideoxygalactose transaminase
MNATTPVKTQIPVLDLSPEINELWDEFNAAFQAVLRSEQFIMGDAVKQFEQSVAAYLGVEHAIGLNSGTDALVIGLRALGIGAGDEVITTSFSFFATAEAISLIGATPVFVEIDPRTFNIDVSQIERAITSRTKAIIPVHLYGQACDMDAVMRIADAHGLSVFEDTAQAFSGEYNGRKLSTIGHAGSLSFFPSKNLGAFGDAGMLVTNDAQVSETARMLRVHGSKIKYHNETVGYNSRLDTLQAAMLNVKLPHVDAWSDARQAAALRYNALLGNIAGVVTPCEAGLGKHVYHQYTVRILGGKRDTVKHALAERGISTMVYYPVPMHKLPVYQDMAYRLPITEQAAGEVLSLPIWPQITLETQTIVADALRETLGG